MSEGLNRGLLPINFLVPTCVFYKVTPLLPGDDNKRDPERENLAVLTIAAQTANVIHIRVMFNAVTRYSELKIGL